MSNTDLEESQRLRAAIEELPPECASSVSVLMNIVVSYATNIAVQRVIEFVPEDKRRQVAYAVADGLVDASALLGSIFTASATKEFFGWGRNFNVNRKNSTDPILRPLLLKAQDQASPLDFSAQTADQKRIYESWIMPFEKATLSPGTQPYVVVSLPRLREIASIAGTPKGSPTYPEGYLTEDQWETEADVDEGLQALLETEIPVHIGYQFAIGPQVAVHHALYFGKDTGPDGGLVIEVMNRIYGPKNEVASFIAPSTLLNFMRRTATNGLNGLLVYTYKRPMNLEVALERAVWAIGKFNYNVMKHNCENFVSWVLLNNDSNSTCSLFRTNARTFVASKLFLAGKKKPLKH